MTGAEAGRRKLLLAAAAIAAVLAAVLWAAWHHANAAPPAAAAAPPAGPSVPLVVARRGTLAVTIGATGRVGPPAGSDAKLAFPLAGIVASVAVRVGDRVAAGEELAALAPGGLASAVAAARADLAATAANAGGGAVGAASIVSAESKLASARARLELLHRGGPAALSDRIAAAGVARQAAVKVASDQSAAARADALYAGGAVAFKDVQLARAQLAADLADRRSADAKVAASDASFSAAIDVARSDVAQAQSDAQAARAQRGNAAALEASARAKLGAAERDLANAVLRAPSDGIVVAVLKHAGEAVDPTTPAIDVVPPYDREVTLAVPVGTASRVHVGDVARLALYSPERAGAGVVRAVVPMGDAASQNATVVVDGLPPGAVAGQSVATVVTVGHVSGIVLPLGAVVTDPQTGGTVVFVRTAARDAPFVRREVAVLANDGTSVVVSGAVRAGDRVAAAGAYTLLAPSA